MTEKGHFPKAGERKVNGEWVMATPEKPKRETETPADRRNYLRRMAGWPVSK